MAYFKAALSDEDDPDNASEESSKSGSSPNDFSEDRLSHQEFHKVFSDTQSVDTRHLYTDPGTRKLRKVPAETRSGKQSARGAPNKSQKLNEAVAELRQTQQDEQNRLVGKNGSLGYDPSRMARDNATPRYIPPATQLPGVLTRQRIQIVDRESEGCVAIGQDILTSELPAFFDRLPHDASFKRTTVHKAFHSIRVNDCIDRPRDPRVVAFLPLILPGHESDEGLETPDCLVMRVELLCNDTHLPPLPEKNATVGDTMADSLEVTNSSNCDDEDLHPDLATLRKRYQNARKHQKNLPGDTSDESGRSRTGSVEDEDESEGQEGGNGCEVTYYIENTVEQCHRHVCTVWQRGRHEEVSEQLRKEFLRISGYVRNHIRRLAGHLGTTLSTVNSDLLQLKKRWTQIPEYRWPNKKAVKNVFHSYRRSLQLHENPLLAAQIMRDRNPEEFFL
ncbi:hypothetical protein QFC24_006184 [Naganishia onofrii]|uniref:Uncharacterized protein n=1 Tax=Naganishia onofrii TaxID=1851511 RepID=A0ACC2X3W3_9TREE|nr:hypothetical protein QFC24_006184 [Naganishia onofrii]